MKVKCDNCDKIEFIGSLDGKYHFCEICRTRIRRYFRHLERKIKRQLQAFIPEPSIYKTYPCTICGIPLERLYKSFRPRILCDDCKKVEAKEKRGRKKLIPEMGELEKPDPIDNV